MDAILAFVDPETDIQRYMTIGLSVFFIGLFVATVIEREKVSLLTIFLMLGNLFTQGAVVGLAACVFWPVSITLLIVILVIYGLVMLGVKAKDSESISGGFGRLVRWLDSAAIYDKNRRIR